MTTWQMMPFITSSSSFQGMEAVMGDASIYVFRADTEGLNFRKAFLMQAFIYLAPYLEEKSLVLSRSPYQWQHEPVLFGWKNKANTTGILIGSKLLSGNLKNPKNKDHPTMKPVALVAYPILNSSLTNSIVLDPFGGSGSTLIACEQTDRICNTIELDEKYTDVIVKRYIEQVGSSDDVYLLRNGKKLPYTDIAKD